MLETLPKGFKVKKFKEIFNNKPLIYYPIKSAKKSKVCDDILFQLTDKKIAREAIKLGANVPFFREKKYSGDFVTTEGTL